MKKCSAAIDCSAPIDHEPEDIDHLPSLAERVKTVLDITNNNNRPASNMIFFVMYDITSNKVRRSVAKYLEEKGCHRVQNSIFLADLPAKVCAEIENDLRVVQEMYENDDSIFVMPISCDHMKAMKVIGKTLDLDLILKVKNTMFF